MTKHACVARLAIAALVVGVLHVGVAPVQAGPVLFEGFDDVSTLGASGWVQTNNSSPAGLNWFQGNSGVFGAQSGASNSYIASNFLAAGFGGDISNWLILPELTLSDGDTFSFFTRAGGAVADRLEVRFSANGGSTNVGGTAGSVGDFTLLLATINPLLTPDGYPTDWIQQTITLSGLGSTSGRLAFRYFVSDTNTNGDYIGIDSVNVVPEPGTLTLLGLGLAGLVSRRRQMSARARAQEGA